MANTKSAIKRVRRISRQTAVNRSRRSRFKNALKKMDIILKKKNKKEALSYLPKLNSELTRMYILELDGDPVGQIRYDRTADGSALSTQLLLSEHHVHLSDGQASSDVYSYEEHGISDDSSPSKQTCFSLVQL